MKNSLCKDIEISLGQSLKTPKDFENLSHKIYNRLNIMVSPTTLKRLWGYLDEKVQTRVTTLDILSRFIGYKDFEDYNSKKGQSSTIESNPILNRRLNTSTDLNPGDSLLITWLPDRKCLVKFKGDLHFVVMESLNTRLTPGDTFQCTLFIEGEPLYIDNLVHGSLPLSAYVCGKKSGIRFEKLQVDSSD